MHTVFLVCALLSVASVAAITIYLILSGAPALWKVGPLEMLFGTHWIPSNNEYGIAYIILTSIIGTGLAVAIGVPVGLMTAVFLAEIATPRLAAVVRPAVELLAGIPSVVYGLLGMLLVKPFMASIESAIFASDSGHQFTGGANLLSAVLVLAIMILPTVISVSETSLRAVPAAYKEASLALGATQIQTIFKIQIPAAKSGISTAVVLGVGRAIGEAMAITLVAGNAVNLPFPFNSVRFLTTGIVSEMGYAVGLHRQALFTIGLVLFVFILLINRGLGRLLKGAAHD